MLLHLSSAALAATVPGDYSSIGEACSAGEAVIEVSSGAVAGGTCYLSGKTVTITGVGDRPTGAAIFQLYDGSSLTLENLSFSPAGDTLFSVYASDLTLSQVSVDTSGTTSKVLGLSGGSVEGTQVEVRGGGGTATLLQAFSTEDQGASVTFRDSRFSDAPTGMFYASGFGSAPLEVFFKDVVFADNRHAASDGGAVRVEQADAGDTFHFEGCEFTGNSAKNGGAIYLEYGSLELHDVTFEGNTATVGGGGAIYANTLDDKHLGLDDSWLCGNAAPEGSALYADDLTLYLDHVALVAQTGGGALSGWKSPLIADHMSLVANTIGISISDSLKVNDSLAWANTLLSEGVGGVQGDYNAYAVGAVESGSVHDLEIDDPGFDGDPTTCAHPPWLSSESVLLGAASDGSYIGAYGVDGTPPDTSVPDSEPPDSPPRTPDPSIRTAPRRRTLAARPRSP